MEMSNKTMSNKIKGIFDGASGARALIYVFLFVASGFGAYHGIKASVVLAQTDATSALKQASVTAAAQATDRNRIAALESNNLLIEFKLTEAAKQQQKQSDATLDLIILTTAIATKLKVKTEELN
jgi:hypothetical protein